MRILSFIFLLGLIGCNNSDRTQYSIPDKPWPEEYGNHRAVININKASDLVKLDIEWRRHDKDPSDRRFIIVNAQTNDTVKNIHRLNVTNERCELVFGPVERSGTYYFYYLPYEIQKGWGFYSKGYLPAEDSPERGLDNLTLIPSATVESIQARTEFDSFWPMEVIALEDEKVQLIAGKSSEAFIVFPEDRKYPIRMKDNIPQKWIHSGPSDSFTGTALRNEYYTFQLGVYASVSDLKDVKIEFSDLSSGKSKIPAAALTCFNTGGTDPYGEEFIKKVDIDSGMVQSFWAGIDIPEDIKPGTYKGTVRIIPQGEEVKEISISIRILKDIIEDRGDSETWRHSRLRWLNSTIGLDDRNTERYRALAFTEEETITMSNKTLSFDEQYNISSVYINGSELLAGAISYSIISGDIELGINFGNAYIIKEEAGIIKAEWSGGAGNLRINTSASVESDGYINYRVELEALENITIDDFILQIPVEKNHAKYMMGMGLPGTKVPASHDMMWAGPHDSFWIGSADAGIWCELRGGAYHGPLLNLYRLPHPESWSNDDNGGLRIRTTKEAVFAEAYSGKHKIEKGSSLVFEWSLLLTPVKEINLASQFNDRYYHRGDKPVPAKEDFEAGINIINVHHANEYNPHINYPFINTNKMKGFVDEMHSKGKKVKIYYTIRELTNYVTEIWALRSLGNEILGDGRGGGYPWLREHFVDGYRHQWYQYFDDKSADASVVNAPGDSRWYNYYIEGLAWLIRNVDIDGLYLDDVSYDRRIVKRMRKVMDKEKPGCIIDLHSNTGFSKGPATQYTEYFPYIDKLWFGESFMYSEMDAEKWLVEVSGIPFGHMGDMLHRGGNRWLGMVFGMTSRHPWLTDGILADPRPIWKIWDEFGIAEANMKGFWDDNAPIKSSEEGIKATSYIKGDSILISIGNFTDNILSARIIVEWDESGINPELTDFYMPEIKDFQEESGVDINKPIEIDARKGFIIIGLPAKIK